MGNAYAILSRTLLAAALCLSGCELLGKPEGEQPVVLHLTLNDSLGIYDSVHIALTPINDTGDELEHVWRDALLVPSNIKTYTLTKAKDPFLVKVRAFRKVYGYNSREQLAVATHIIYEGGRKRVEHLPLPPLDPLNRLSRLEPTPGSLDPSFAPEATNYTLRVGRGVTSVTFDMAAEYSHATAEMGGKLITTTAPKRVIPISGRDTVVTVTVTDLGETRTYSVLLMPEKPSPLALQTVEHSIGVMTPEFDSDSLDYRLVLSAVTPSVDLRLWPADPANTIVTFQGATVFPGATRTVHVDTVGGSVTATAVVSRDGATREYRFNVIRSP